MKTEEEIKKIIEGSISDGEARDLMLQLLVDIRGLLEVLVSNQNER